ncbi:MAG: serine protease [Planctomycetota bacterium]
MCRNARENAGRRLGAALSLLVAASCSTPAPEPLFDRCRANLERPVNASDAATQREFLAQMSALVRDGDTASLGTFNEHRGTGNLRPLPARGRVRPSEVIYDECAPGVVIVGRMFHCDQCPRQHLSTSSGFMVSADGVFVTNSHVLQGDPEDHIAIMTSDGAVHPVVELLARDRAADVAVARAVAKRPFAPLPLRQDARVGEEVFVISHPAAHYHVMTSGIVARGTHTGRSPAFMITAPYARGSSGGPVLDARGNVVGMVKSTKSIYHEPMREVPKNLQMVMRYCVPSAAVLNVLRGSGGSRQRAE